MFYIGKVNNILTCKHGKGEFLGHTCGAGDKESIPLGYTCTPLGSIKVKKQFYNVYNKNRITRQNSFSSVNYKGMYRKIIFFHF